MQKKFKNLRQVCNVPLHLQFVLPLYIEYQTMTEKCYLAMVRFEHNACGLQLDCSTN